jgi:hypothetical protein
MTGGSGDELYLQPEAGGTAWSPLQGEDGEILQVHTRTLSWFYTVVNFSMSCVQCCGSGMFIPHPGSEYFHPGSRIRIKEFKYFNPQEWFLSLRNLLFIPDPDPGSQSRTQIFTNPGLDLGVKKALDTGSGSATLLVL